MNIVKYLESREFVLYTYSGENKRYRKDVNEKQSLYVRVYSEANELIDVEYESVANHKYDSEGIVNFESIDTLEKLENLLSAIF